MKQNELTEFESEVMKKLLDGDLKELSILREQLHEVAVAKREYTDFGFFTNIVVSDNKPRIDLAKAKIGDVYAKVEGMEGGIGFLLFIDKGKLNMLEGFTYGEEKFPKNVSDYQLEYIPNNKRDKDALRKELSI